MDLLSIFTFIGAIFIFMATPGPGVLAVISRALGSGFSHAMFMSLGMVLGDIIFLLLTIFGLSVIASTFSTIFIIIKILGGIYLIYLGIKMYMSKTSYFDTNIKESSSFAGDFFAGVFITLSNPKVIAFYVGFLPTFIDLSNLTYEDTALVVFLVLTILSLILSSYAYFASKAKESIRHKKTQTILNRVAGTVMIFVGGLLILKK
ncbi:MAG: LysE family translocator [Sulfurospirillum sp.]